LVDSVFVYISADDLVVKFIAFYENRHFVCQNLKRCFCTGTKNVLYGWIGLVTGIDICHANICRCNNMMLRVCILMVPVLLQHWYQKLLPVY